MKCIWVLIFFILLISFVSTAEIDLQEIESLALNNAAAIWGEVDAAAGIPYYDLNDEIVAWRFNFALKTEFPAASTLRDICRDNFLQKGQINICDGSFGRMLLGASTELPVVMKYSECLSQEYAMGWKAEELAEKYTGSEVRLERMYFINSANLWYCFSTGKEKVFVKLHPPQKVCDEAEFKQLAAEQKFFCKLEDRSAEWQEYLEGRKTLTRNIFYIDNYELVPYYDWSYGCSPTSATMALAYWDVISTFSFPNYSLLVDYHFYRNDTIEGEWDYQVSNLQRELAIAMETDTLDAGYTSEEDIAPGIEIVTNDEHSYSFDCSFLSGSNLLSDVIGQIILDRPCLVSEPGHTNCGIGYNSDTDHAGVHNTHDNTIDWIHESGLDGVVSIDPGGGYGEGINLEFPRGDVGYNSNGGGEVLFAGSVYEISWDTDNEYRDNVDIWLSITGNGSHANEMLVEDYPNTGYYDWDTPDFWPEFDEARIGIALYDEYDELLGQDTSLGNFIITPGGFIPELNDDISHLNSREPQYYRFDHSHSSWAVVGLRAQTPGDDWDLKLFSDTEFDSLLTGSYLSEEIPVEFIVVDGNHAPYEERGVKIYRDLGEDQARIEYEGGNDALALGSNGPFTWLSDDDVVEMWDLPLQPGTYSIILEPTGGDANLDMALFGFEDGTYYGNRWDALEFSTYLGSEISEFISLDIEEADIYGLCVWGNNSHSNSYTIRVEQPGTWRGAISSSWYEEENWSAGIIPGSTDDVVIPTGTIYDLRLIDSGVNCHDMVIQFGATVHINNCYLNVYGDLEVRGELEMVTNLAKMICYEDIYWYENSEADIQDGSSEIWVQGDWYFLENTAIELDNGYVEFDGANNSEIICRSPDSYFNHLRSDKDLGNWVANSYNSTYPLVINGNFFNYADSYFIGWSMNTTIFRGWFNHYEDARFEYANGTCRFEGTNQHIELNTGDFFNDLTIAGSVILDSNILIEGDLEIESGELISDSYTIQLKGDWDNQVGFGGFLEYSGIVSFTGYGIQMVNGETFATLTINKSNGELRFNEGISYCDDLVWTQGTLRINGGELTALDFGSSSLWHDLIVTSGRLEIQKPSGWLDVNNNFTISGGEVHIEGATVSDSYWAYDDDVVFTMSGGVLDYHDTGIRLCDDYNLNETITGGTIRTAGDFTCERADFDIGGGTLEQYGSTDAELDMVTGSSLHNLTINKSPVRDSGKNEEIAFSRIDARTGQLTVRNRENNVTAVNNLDINGSFLLQSGNFVAPTFMWVEGDWTNYAGLDYFDEGSGVVNFNGNSKTMIAMGERFYNLFINKSLAGSDSLKLLAGKTFKVTNTLQVNEGLMEAEEGVNLYLDNVLKVEDGGTLFLHGISGNPVKVFSSSGFYEFRIKSGATIIARYCEFQNMNSDGINIEDGALVDPDSAFYMCTFKNGEGTFLTLDNTQDLLITEPLFDLDINLRLYNVAKNTDQGSVTLLDATGSFAGNDHTYDPYNRITWQNRSDLYISNVIWSETLLYGGDTLSCSVVVKNSGLGESGPCFLDLYLNEFTTPASGQVGDLYLSVAPIDPGDSVTYEFTDISHYTPCQWSSWFQIDTDQTVLEVDDENNVWGPDNIVWQPLPVIDDLAISGGSNSYRQINLSWSYPISVSRFIVYGDAIPDFIPSVSTMVTETESNSCSIAEQLDKYFYKVIAIRDSTARKVELSNNGIRRN